MIKHSILGQTLWLSPQRCIFWEEERLLILSDLHAGKTGHFRKSGIAIPQNVYKEDLQRLISLIQHFSPQQLIIVGDLFHSKENKELDLFRKWRSDLSTLPVQLIKGNHDILKNSWYEQADIIVNEEELVVKDFCFRHDPATKSDDCENARFHFTGHVHPAISMYGMGKQSLRFPCFYFSNDHCVLPAFSRFTGTYTIRPEKGDDVFAIVENSVMKLT